MALVAANDGTDKPGYRSGFMSMKFWRHDPRALIDADETWHAFRYAGLRVTPARARPTSR